MATMSASDSAFVKHVASMRAMVESDGAFASLQYVNRLLILEKCLQPFNKAQVPVFRNSCGIEEDYSKIPPAPSGAVVPFREIPRMKTLSVNYERIFKRHYQNVLKHLLTKTSYRHSARILFDSLMSCYQAMVIEKFRYFVTKFYFEDTFFVFLVSKSLVAYLLAEFPRL